MSYLTDEVVRLSDGVRTSVEIGKLLGTSPRYVRKIQWQKDLPRLSDGARAGSNNHQFETGRRVGTAGYVLVTAPPAWPSAKPRSGRKASLLIFEHRLVWERANGRYLLPSEKVDHVDGLTLHNAPENLRVFASNREHLQATLTGKVPRWSREGRANMFVRHHLPEALEPVDTYRRCKASGDVRLRQILLLALRLGLDSPYLLGTTRHTKKAQIDMTSRSTIERAWVDLCARWEWDPSL